MTTYLTERERMDALAALTRDERASLPADVAAALAERVPRSLGSITASIRGVDRATNHVAPLHATAGLQNLLVTSTGGPGGRLTVVPHPMVPEVPLLAAVPSVDVAPGEGVYPVDVTYASNADVTPEGDSLPESDLTYTMGAGVSLDPVGHWIPITAQALRHNAGLQAEVDQFLSGGLLTKLEQLIANRLAAVAASMAQQAFTTDRATTIRTAIAKAQTVMRQLGAGPITVALSPLDHAALDLSGHRVTDWPATIVSSPALPVGTAYVGRLGLAASLFAAPIDIQVGTINNMFIQNTRAVIAVTEARAHVSAPAAIVRASLT